MADYDSNLTGKRVTLVRTDGTSEEGTVVEVGPGVGVIFKAKGSSQQRLVEDKDIKTITLAEGGPKKLRSRTIPRVSPGKFREHLIERHGYKISEIDPLTEAEAEAYHEKLDHADLGHKHRELTEAEKAIQLAEASRDDAA